MEKSLIVQGRGLEDALDKAAIVLHCDRERVAYEILQDARPGRYGQPGVPCKLRVTPVSPSAEEMNAPNARAADAAILHVPVPLSEGDLGALPSALFLKELGEAVARDLVTSAWPQPEPRTPERRVIAGPITLSDGPIDHVGDLRVGGSVRKGARVKASGAIWVEGGVETAFLDAGEDITIREGLLGTARSARGTIRCRFAQGATIQAPCGDVVVAESAMHCRIHAGKSATVGEILLGGSCYGEDLVVVRVAGSDSGVPTLLQAGPNRALHEQIEQVRERARRAVGWLAESSAVRQELLSAEEAGQPLPPADRLRLWRAVVRAARLNADLRRLQARKSTLLGMINAERGSRVCVTDRAFPRVKIVIDDSALEVGQLTQFATFSKDYEAGDLRVTPYQ